MHAEVSYPNKHEELFKGYGWPMVLMYTVSCSSYYDYLALTVSVDELAYVYHSLMHTYNGIEKKCL